MFHAFLRYFFGIQPLFLVLIPETSSVDEKDIIRKQYLILLSLHLDQLANASERLGGECKQSRSEELNCNTTQKIYDMTWKLNRLSNCTMNADLKNNLTSVYNHTSSLLKKYIKEEKKHQKTDICRKSNSPALCRIKKNISKLKLCWIQYIT
ncbi:interleukin-7 isoform X1 [Paroedura picta]|uniref:interleukin-7 isoform X1 n=1 Tax=Paroedura picta TaxID=143630 RepID=UPI00405654AE